MTAKKKSSQLEAFLGASWNSIPFDQLQRQLEAISHSWAISWNTHWPPAVTALKGEKWKGISAMWTHLSQTCVHTETVYTRQSLLWCLYICHCGVSRQTNCKATWRPGNRLKCFCACNRVDGAPKWYPNTLNTFPSSYPLYRVILGILSTLHISLIQSTSYLSYF